MVVAVTPVSARCALYEVNSCLPALVRSDRNLAARNFEYRRRGRYLLGTNSSRLLHEYGSVRLEFMDYKLDQSAGQESWPIPKLVSRVERLD